MWDDVYLGDLFRIGSSKRVLKSQWQPEGVPFYRGREVTCLAKHGAVDNKLFISENLYREHSEKYGVPQCGDIVITAIGTIGNSYIVRGQDRFYFKDASVLWLKRTSDVSSEFINHWLKSPLMKKQLDKGNGATVDTLTIKKLQSLIVKLPPKVEQERISTILDKVFEGIDSAVANAEKNLTNAREIFENHLNSIFTQKGNGWVATTLGNLCEKVEYGTSSKSKPEGSVPVLRMGNIQNGKFSWEKLAYTDNNEEIEKYLLKKNDVLFNRTNSAELVGKTAIYKGERPAIFAGYLIRVHRKEELIDAEFLNYYLNSIPARAYGETVMSRSINQANINGTKLKQYPISIPSLKKQQKIVRKLRVLEAETQRLEAIYQQKLTALAELKQSLLQKAFSGELTKDAIPTKKEAAA